ncbi:hypothetical protein ElyMa_002694300 [Elysia marginata]|uniref:Uncharacterized protein n=1 Tax=Elysia marginata TaxID=1093978 RepID=A0AAV4HD11_9GAST|nr:hypothetical protein ElyMa_002694300 [Elysia marginata]
MVLGNKKNREIDFKNIEKKNNINSSLPLTAGPKCTIFSVMMILGDTWWTLTQFQFHWWSEGATTTAAAAPPEEEREEEEEEEEEKEEEEEEEEVEVEED